MKNSTVLLVFGILGLGGVGTYLYLKNKKNSVVSSLPTSTTTPTTTTPTNVTYSVADDTLGLSPKPTSLIDETKTNNYIIAKNLSEEIAGLQDEIKNLELEYSKWSKDFVFRGVGSRTFYINSQRFDMVTKPTSALTRKMEEKSKQANALGYKILPYGLIEKM